MVKIKVISFILSLLLLLQMLPVSAIGKALFQNQWTEELPHHADEDGMDDAAKFKQLYEAPLNHFVSSVIMEQDNLLYIHLSERIPHNHSTDITSPPPDLLS